MTRTQLIAEIAEDIASGFQKHVVTRADVMDILYNEERLKMPEIERLMSMDDDVRAEARAVIEAKVKVGAIDYLRNVDRGMLYIDDKMSEAERERQADEEFERKYGEAA